MFLIWQRNSLINGFSSQNVACTVQPLDTIDRRIDLHYGCKLTVETKNVDRI